MTKPSRRLQRERTEGGHARVTFVELFFDLVFVFTITQLSHTLLHHLTPAGALQALLLLFPVWWVWIYTAWATNWLDPETTPVRLMLFALMFAGLILSASIPQAFGDRGLWFAGAYVAMQVGRSLFTAWALRGHAVNLRNFQRITIWFAVSGVFWIVGALLDGETRFAVWTVAMLIEFAAPALGYWTPGLGRARSSEWEISGGHLAERAGLFVIIALGEAIVINGATFAELPWEPATVAAFAVALIGSIAMWWIYFNIGAERGSHLIEHSDDPGRIARFAYTYLHVVIIAGLIASAAGDEIGLTHPTGHTDIAAVLLLSGGPMVFLVGCLGFKWATAGWPPLSHLVGLGLLLASFAAAPFLPVLAVASLAAAILVAVAAWETISLRAPAR